MKNFKFLLLPLFLLAASMTFVSCNNDSTGDSTNIGRELCTARKNIDGNYVFYSDNNTEIHLTAASSKQVADLYKNGLERIYLYYQYNASDVSQSAEAIVVKNAVAVQGTQKVTVDEFMTTAIATEKKQLESDSLFNINSIDLLYAYKGYLNVGGYGQYSVVDGKGILPSLSAVVDESDISENAITVHLYYNRHSPSKAIVGGTIGLTQSFRINSWSRLIPGSDDVTLTLKVEGADNKLTKQCKIARKQFTTYNYIN